MDKKQYIPIVAAIVAVIVVAAAAVYVLNNDDDQKDTYYFYISSDKSIGGWHSAQGNDAADAFANAMKADNIEYEINDYGYLAKIGDQAGSWYSAMYLYGNTSKLAAEASVKYPVQSYDSYYSSNGWVTINGYTDDSRSGDKLWEMNGYIFFFSMYDSTTYAHADPTTDTKWMNAGPFESNKSFVGSDETYYFYIDAGDLTGWYSAKGKDAADAFANAMKAKNIAIEFNKSGYLSKIGDQAGSWYSAMYLYGSMSKLAAEASVKYPVQSYSAYHASNGWITISGYDDSDRSGDKLWEMNGNVFFFSMYDSTTYTHSDPTTATAWSTTGPFAA